MTSSILVVGAGPAGATAARTLARAGVTVRLLDRSNVSQKQAVRRRHQPRALKRFPYLERELARIATHTVARLYLEGPGGESTIIDADGPAALDDPPRRVRCAAGSLARRSRRRAGRRRRHRAGVIDRHRRALVARDGRRFEAPIVIAADGVHSVVARRLGINPGWPASSVALDMMEETPRDGAARSSIRRRLWVAYGFGHDPASNGVGASGVSDGHGDHSPGRPKGMPYVFPKRDHVNVGIGYVLAHYRDARLTAPPTSCSAGSWIICEPGRDRRANRCGATSRRSSSRSAVRSERPGRGRVLLAGDAGGFVNGFTAEGIYYAMVSGDLAGQIRHRDASRDRRPARTARIDGRAIAEIGAELRDSVLIQRYLFADRRRIARVDRGCASCTGR